MKFQDALNPQVRLTTVPNLRLKRKYDISGSDRQTVNRLIDALIPLDTVDRSCSPGDTWTSFAPLPKVFPQALFFFGQTKLAVIPTFQSLVAQGHRAIPALLDRLTDATSTHVVVGKNIRFGNERQPGNIFAHIDIRGNRAVARERAILDALKTPLDPSPDPWLYGEKVGEIPYTVPVGDLCFLALGQILGRPYYPVEVGPASVSDGAFPINLHSPIHSPQLCSAVRTLWQSNRPAEMLFLSLLRDFSTRGVYSGGGLDDWGPGSEIQASAALRLLYFFPDESVPLLVTRLDSLDVMATYDQRSKLWTDEMANKSIRREVRNGIVTTDFIEAVCWSKHPAIVRSLRAIKRRTDDERILRVFKEQGFV